MSSEVTELIINVDGACKGNPGPSGVGAVIRDKNSEVLVSISEYIGVTTNNAAEYLALIFALQEALVLRARRVKVFTDSELMTRQFSGQYQVKNDQIKLFSRIIKNLVKKFDSVEVKHVPREENQDADLLAGKAVEEHL